MQNKRGYKIISLTLFFIGAFLIINEQAEITGAVIGFSGQPGFSAILGFSFIISSLILFMAGSTEGEGPEKPLEHIVKKYDPKIKSFRRWLEKDLHKKFNYEQAEKTYRDVEKRYWNSVGKGKKPNIKQPENGTTLQFIEDFLEEKENHRYIEGLKENQYKEKQKELLNDAGRALEDGQIYTGRDELLRMAEKCGYKLIPGKQDENKVLKVELDEEGNPKLNKKGEEITSIVTNIPHSPNINRRTARGILTALASGKSSYRPNEKYKRKD